MASLGVLPALLDRHGEVFEDKLSKIRVDTSTAEVPGHDHGRDNLPAFPGAPDPIQGEFGGRGVGGVLPNSEP
jgi:hypothetical protein